MTCCVGEGTRKGGGRWQRPARDDILAQEEQGKAEAAKHADDKVQVEISFVLCALLKPSGWTGWQWRLMWAVQKW